MKKLDIVKYYFAFGQMVMVWHRYNDTDGNENSAGIWFALKEFNKDEVLQYANMHVDKDITVTVL